MNNTLSKEEIRRLWNKHCVYTERLTPQCAFVMPFAGFKNAMEEAGTTSNEEGGYYYDLFKFFSDEHGLVLVDTEIQDIIQAVESFNNHPIRKIINEK